VLTISEKAEEYAEEVYRQLIAAGVRAEKDFSPEKIGSKIREGRNARVPYLLTVGEKDSRGAERVGALADGRRAGRDAVQPVRGTYRQGEVGAVLRRTAPAEQDGQEGKSQAPLRGIPR
jgi:histidyl-tRNA synthetase